VLYLVLPLTSMQRGGEAVQLSRHSETTFAKKTLGALDTRGTNMDHALYSLIEPIVIFGTLLGTAFGVKLLIWGKGPIKQIRRPAETPELTQRVADLEDRLEQSNEVIAHQAELLDEMVERVDFTERMLTRQRNGQPKGLEGPG
jgi:hypothetical protein